MSTSLQELQSSLWDAANTLRGSAVDRTDWKGYILPLLFFKRISDVWDEETSAAREIYGGADPSLFPEVHRFVLPKGCHWDDIRAVPANVGATLQKAMQEIERANPDTLFRVFGSADWGNKEKFSDHLLKDLIEGFSEIALGNTAVSTDVLGDAYEYLVAKFADVTRRNKAGEFYTPRSVVRMMVEILDPKEGESIYDPACGTGGMLLGAIEHVSRKGGDPRTFYGKIYGQEKNLTTAAIARMNLVLHGIEDFQVAREDTLRNPAFKDSSTGGLATFDCVIANPPFSLKEWGRDLWEADPWGRAQYGIPPDSYGDYAFVQQMVSSMAPTSNSRMAVVLPQGALFRKGAEGSIRQALLERDMVEAVIGLAPNLFYGTQLAGCVVTLRRRKPAVRKNKVLIIDASSLFRKGRAQNFLDHEQSDQIVAWYRAYEDVEDRAKVVMLDDIKKEGWTLNVSRYVLPPIGHDVPPLPEAVEVFKTALAEARAAEDHLRTVLVEGGWLQ
ncbi:type I restriction-modification system subunit M [Methylobacterium longum]|uniref:site-specific DNA-methyltransferase (adenine-specific) n=1 Tax=Methylobacterium longum TaxID=767694 RepID=A0ABT8ATH3_9HYPH|nr:class I SAM-dependent DNA methyltransferase [Methylobacterium longum]MDN3572801.1 class I SAM-dependent DNA methyltransferase [Methylobacterium longum]GJE10074.1 putative type I restriction enzymeP M protein [Methylobacterium longum]